MQRLAILGAKAIIAILMAISLAGQILIVPLMADEVVREFPEAAYLRWPGIVGCVAIVACVQVALVCMWRLLSMVARESIFRPSAFRYVDAIVGATVAATALCLVALGILGAARTLPPAVMLLLLMCVVGGIGLALLLVVMRGLLTKATELEHDLAEVI